MSKNYSITETSDHKYIQTTPVRHSTNYSNTGTPGHMYTQTILVKHSTKYTNTCTYKKYSQTDTLSHSSKYTNNKIQFSNSTQTTPMSTFPATHTYSSGDQPTALTFRSYCYIFAKQTIRIYAYRRNRM